MSQPCSGASHVCSTISTEKVIWMAGSVAPVAAWNGATNRVHTYCGLEIDIMAIRPRASCPHLSAGIAGAISLPRTISTSFARLIRTLPSSPVWASKAKRRANVNRLSETGLFQALDVGNDIVHVLVFQNEVR